MRKRTDADSVSKRSETLPDLGFVTTARGLRGQPATSIALPERVGVGKTKCQSLTDILHALSPLEEPS